MKYFIIFSLLIFSSLFFLTSNSAFGWCPQNEDWPDRPCYAPYQDFGIEKERSDWEPYYDFKGSEWMESKKQEMIQAIQNDALFDWIESTPETQAHHNVHEYYFIFSEVPNLDGKFIDEIELSSSSWNVDEYSTGDPIPIQEEEPLVPEPIYESSNHESPLRDPSCGVGTTYKDGICIVDETKEKTIESSEKWGGLDRPIAIFDCDVDQIYNKETQTCDVRLNSIDIFMPIFILILILCFVIYLIWRKRK
ncbi:MAG: hypothetical protein IIC67_03330 [Thaumarchaeota archaeon]|nr:hypothetical protein [Nitrososphaerota archaeon]